MNHSLGCLCVSSQRIPSFDRAKESVSPPSHFKSEAVKVFKAKVKERII